jgi:hypothetical protein
MKYLLQIALSFLVLSAFTIMPDFTVNKQDNKIIVILTNTEKEMNCKLWQGEPWNEGKEIAVKKIKDTCTFSNLEVGEYMIIVSDSLKQGKVQYITIK